MKLTKQHENEVLRMYDTWLYSYLNGDVKTYDSYLDVDYHFIGSTDNEEFLDKKDTTNFFKETANQLAGKTEIRNSIRTVEKLGGLIFITDLFDAYFLNGTEWAYYGRFRFTSVIRKKDDGWRFVYQHFSMPDAKAQEGETLGTEQITKENQELRDAIKRRTVELEHKNRELEIEASLERVRARSLAMQSSDELLDASDTLFAELEKLSIHALRIGICTIDGKSGAAEIWSRSENKKTKESKILGVVPKGTHPVFDDMVKAWKAQKASFSNTRKGLAVKAYYEKVSEYLSYPLPKKYNREESITAFFFPEGALNVVSLLPLGKQDHEIMLRFAKVFGQIYQRFLDLKKAEAQTREAEVELALERVRSRTMAMQKSDELKGVVKMIFDQLAHLGINAEHAGIVVDYEPKKDFHFWVADNQDIPARITVPYLDLVWDRQYTEAKKKNKDFFTTQLDFEEKNSFYKKLLPHIEGLTKKARDFYLNCPGLSASTVIQKDIGLYIENFSGIPFSDGENSILMRFGKVFQQTYTRFLDLQKAEAQAREAQIENALEKVRSRTMAMQHSDELPEAANVLFLEVQNLGIPAWSCGYNILTDDKKSSVCIMSSEGELQEPFVLPLTEHKSLKPWYNAIVNDEEFFVYGQDGEDLVAHYDYMKSLPELKGTFEQFEKAGLHLPARQFNHLVRFNEGFLLFITYEAVPEAHDIFKRFGKVFEQTYTRFLDLQKAEAQAREAQIEVALERVRASAMAMHASEDLWAVTGVLREQMAQLGEKELESIIIQIYKKERDEFEAWYSYRNPEDPNGKIINDKAVVEWGKTAKTREDRKKYLENGTDYTIVADHKMLKEWYLYLDKVAPMVVDRDSQGSIIVPEVLYYNYSKFSGGVLLLITNDEAMEQSKNLLKRSAEVFNMAYTRFLDLQKAEAQAREAQIEAALERVRSRSMAMHQSEELSDVIAVVSEQLQQLKIRFDHVSFAINSEAEDYHFWTALYGKPHPYELKVPYLDNPIANRAMEVRAKGLSFYQDTLTPEENREWLEHAFKYNPADYLSAEEKAYVMSRGFSRSFALMPNILLAVGNYASKPYSEEDNEIIKRFAGVFEQSYTRFLDLKKAEAQARESQVEAALERVRAKSMAMHKSEELADLSLELVQQVQALGVATWFCAFNIYDDDPQGSLEWGSNGQGTFPRYRTPREGIFLRYYEAGQKGESLLINKIGEKECATHYDYLCTLPGVGEQLLNMKEAGISFPKSQIDHVAFFKYGYILFITYEPVPESHDIFKRFAKVFEQTYTRFLDLQKAEELANQAQIDLENLIAAKKKTEEALTELKATQSQLIQAEKMASLGELTAGIAHEIQNPLNFVNNFSEVSNELVDEMNEELDKGDIEEAKAISADIKQNLEKINHHGKRADAIVKGMLQHSRSSSGAKEPIDINALCDEYLRLAYHGLRAKDKSFNATMNTDFDASIGNVNVVPQDMGRVILNLITNAFYAITERKNAPRPLEGGVTYEPTVWVSSKRLPSALGVGVGGGAVEISVRDNGNGIPENVKEKIFQPFFTTKPTGQGTGLGLSLSYDIVKAHGGNLTVETEKGVGTTLMINLPLG